MDYLRKQQLLAEANKVRPGLGDELSRFPISTSAELDQLEAVIEEHRQNMSAYATLLSEYQRQRDEYHRLTARSQAKIAASGMAELAPGALAAARQLGATAAWLGLNTAAEGAMVAALVAKDAEELKHERVQAQRTAAAAELRAAAASATRLAQELGSALEAAARSQAAAEGGMAALETERRTLDAKADNYIRRIGALQAKLAENGYRPELSHDSLTALAAEVDSLERQLAEARQALAAYDSIPPSADGLASLLKRSTQELEEMQKAMSSAFVHGSVPAGRG